jgi:hypothetical protein
LILVLGRPLTFRGDEWAFITERSLGDPGTWFQPHLGHWATVPVLVYRTLVETFGLGSYAPYLAVLAILHACVAGAVLVLVRREVGEWAALGASVVVLFLGRGFENLFWGFQIGFVGGVAAGLWGLAALRQAEEATRSDSRRRRLRAAGAVLLTIAVASTLTGAVVLGAVWVEALCRRRGRLARAAWLAVPSGALAAWWIVFRPPVDHFGSGLQLDAVLVAQFVVVGVLESLGAIAGWGPVAGLVVLVMALASLAARRSAIGLPARFLGPSAAVVALFVLVAVSRGVLGPEAAASARYIYVGAVLALVGLAPLYRGVHLPAFQRRRVVLGCFIAFELAVVGNLRWMGPGRDRFTHDAHVVRAAFVSLDDPAFGAATSSWRYEFWTPAGPDLLELRAQYGEPAQARGQWWDPPPIPPTTLDAVRAAIAREQFSP